MRSQITTLYRSAHFTWLILALGVTLLAGCTTSPNKEGNSNVLTTENIFKQPPPIVPGEQSTGIDVSPNAKRPPVKPEIETGTGKFFRQPPAESAAAAEGQVTFNFENQPVQAVIKAILGDMLQENYTIAPGVTGNVTYSTAKPIRREDAMPVLEMLLAWTGNALVREGNRYTVMQVKDAIPGKLTPRAGATQMPGYALRIYPLRYISPTEMAKLMKPYAKPEAFVSVEAARSLLVLAGTPTELDNYQRTIDTFDVDWMKGMSVGVFTMQHVDVGKLMPELDDIFGSKGDSPLAGMFRFMPIEQTNSIVVITPQVEYLKQAGDWIDRLDRGSAENSPRLYIYEVKNLKAADLADYLGQIFVTANGSSGSRRSSTSGSVAPGLRSTTVGSSGFGGTGTLGSGTTGFSGTSTIGSGSSGGFGGSLSSFGSSSSGGLGGLSSSSSSSSRSGTGTGTLGSGANNQQKQSDIRISAIDENNQLLVMAQPFEWDQIQAAIRKIDVMPLQVQIEARVLEVTLTGDLQFGVQWWLGNQMTGPNGGTYTTGSSQYEYPNPYHRMGAGLGSAISGTPSLSYTFINSKFQVAIQALETSGLAKSLSAPSMVVNNNQEAELSVGTQIPIVQNYYGYGYGYTGSTTTGLDSSSIGTVQYLNTGVTLDVKPRVNPGGLVYLDISQQVSVPGSSSGSVSGNPPINNRQFQTQLAVQNGQTVLLGGLIQDTLTDSTTGIPFLSRIPIIGNLFGSTDHNTTRTELIVLITPRVISNADEARQMTEDYSSQFESLPPLHARTPATTSSTTPAASSAPPATSSSSQAASPSTQAQPSTPPAPAKTYPINQAKPPESSQDDK